MPFDKPTEKSDGQSRPHPRKGSHFRAPSDAAPSSAASEASPTRETSAPTGAVAPDPFSSAARTHSAVGFGSGHMSAGVGPDIASEAPRPIGVDPAETGSFTKLGSGEGAVIPTRDNADAAADAARSSLRSTRSERISGRHRPETASHEQNLQVDKRLFIGLGIAAVIVIVVVCLLVKNAYDSTSTPATTSSQIEQTQVSADQTISYGGYTYGITTADDGAYAFTRTAEGSSSPLTLFELTGTPVSVVLYDGSFVIAENNDGSWDVMIYVMGDGSVASQLCDSSGDAVGGDGTLSSATLDGSNLTLVDDQGKTTSVTLDNVL
ncbi:MAG: hypothetical protein LKI25_06490 [Atopobiaceae bacterium]|jgi:hypothetical protein|nr:hypothetical protein [Atopobiaceae bacterium]MCI2173845.1 hypothetical protein [Atopobiaceae bacterium]MCI2208065.1 hypothetical protein [Atopobiaceae bacterium]